MRDFNLVKESLIDHLNRSFENSDGTIFWCDGTMAVLFAMMSLCFDIEHNHKIEAKPMSNADRIRSMTDEELGKLLNEFGHCPLSRIEDDCRSYDRCRDCWIDWLKEEVKDDSL